MKLKLNIELNDEKYSVNAIKNDNKYIYNYKDSYIRFNSYLEWSDIIKIIILIFESNSIREYICWWGMKVLF